MVTAGEGRLLSRDAGAAAEEWTDGLTAGDETAGGNLVFYVKNTENGAISTAVTETYQIDKTDPTGDGFHRRTELERPSECGLL